ncbi:alpha/beta fold hydrolase [Macrococcoides caseolyticum]|uniref:alpha/beta fold hydrolase n=1 Tax=Macrococcoides caseolyticum TaxID=69966 RepID=UPI001F26DE44|nr:alpha/beta fold hydrolase [Macrococcus caseolyticus]MCE4957198.1 alpha/beta fold hydrolase [Macrococcus caseolyticus]
MVTPDYKIITLKDNTQLEIIVFQPLQPKGTVQILHGMSEHIDRYLPVARYFASLGYVVIMHNQRGHGKKIDEKTRGHFDSIETLVFDAYEVLETYKVTGRTILLGHSMGSIVARKYLSMYKDLFTDCILSGTGYYDAKYHASIPLLKTLIKVHGEEKILKSVNAMSTKQFNKKFKPLRTNSDWLSLNRENVDRFVKDPYCGFDVSLKVLLSVAQSMKETQSRQCIKLMHPDLNLLFLSGADDPFSNFGKGIQSLAKKYNRAGIHNVTVQLYLNARHEVLNESNQQEVLNNIGKWLNRYE